MMKDFFVTLFAALVAFFTPAAPLMLIVVLAILLDTLFGVIASMKLKKPILSRKLQRICVKMLVYLPLILLAYPIDIYILNDFTQHTFNMSLFLTRLTTVIIVGIEIFSVDEKIRAFNNQKGIAHYFNKILNTIREARKKISSVVENKDPEI
jgi:hypothetical protein